MTVSHNVNNKNISECDNHLILVIDKVVKNESRTYFLVTVTVIDND